MMGDGSFLLCCSEGDFPGPGRQWIEYWRRIRQVESQQKLQKLELTQGS